jgi:hypothetical protein
MSAKIAVISSITWLIGWMRPALGRRLAHRQRDVDLLGGEPRGDGAHPSAFGPFAAPSASVTRFFSPLIAGPGSCRSSGAHAAQRLQQLGDRALLAERGDAHGLDRRSSAAAAMSESRLLSRIVSVSLTAVLRTSRLSPTPPLYGSLRCPPLSCRTSPPQGGRSAGRKVFANRQRRSSHLPPCGGDVRQDRGGTVGAIHAQIRKKNKEKPAPALPARVSQIRFSNAWEARWLRRQRVQTRSGWCSSGIRARPWPCATSAANACGSWIAMSDSTLRSISMPALLRPSMKRP